MVLFSFRKGQTLGHCFCLGDSLGSSGEDWIMACVLQVSFLERGISRHVFASVDVCVWQGGLAPNMRSPSFSFRKGKLSPICFAPLDACVRKGTGFKHAYFKFSLPERGNSRQFVCLCGCLCVESGLALGMRTSSFPFGKSCVGLCGCLCVKRWTGVKNAHFKFFF